MGKEITSLSPATCFACSCISASSDLMYSVQLVVVKPKQTLKSASTHSLLKMLFAEPFSYDSYLLRTWKHWVLWGKTEPAPVQTSDLFETSSQPLVTWWINVHLIVVEPKQTLKGVMCRCLCSLFKCCYLWNSCHLTVTCWDLGKTASVARKERTSLSQETWIARNYILASTQVTW